MRLKTLMFIITSSTLAAASPKMDPRACHPLISSAVDTDLLAIVTALPDHTVIPDQLLTFNANTPRDSIPLAEALIARFQLKETEWRKTNTIQTQKIDLSQEGEILLFFPPGKILARVQNGFANYHQAGTTKGGHRTRHEEDNFLGLTIPHSPTADVLRAKSAYLNVKKNINLGVGTAPLHERYGAIAAKMKDEVKNRSLIANDDSLAIADTFRFPQIMRHLTTFAAKTLSQESLALHEYNEVLIYGALDFSDVEYFLVIPEELTTDQLQQLKSFGIPVYPMAIKRLHNRWVYDRKN